MGLSKLTDPGLLTFSDRHLKKKNQSYRRDGELQMRNIRLSIYFYAVKTSANRHQKTSSCTCMEFRLTQESHTIMV